MLKSDMIYLGEQAQFIYDKDIHDRFLSVRGRVLRYISIRDHLSTVKDNVFLLADPHARELKREQATISRNLTEEISGKLPIALMEYLRIKDFRTEPTTGRKSFFRRFHSLRFRKAQREAQRR